MKEAVEGWVSTPKHITEDITHSIPLSPRFAIEEQQGNDTKKKIRLIGDFGRSEVNSPLKLHDASVPDTVDTMFAMARAFALSWPNVVLMLTIMDFAQAYKQTHRRVQ